MPCLHFNFKPKNLLLRCTDAEKLVQCRWLQMSPSFYLTFRSSLGAYNFLFWILSIILMEKPNRRFLFIYFTMWGYTILTLDFVIKAVISIIYFHWLKKDSTLDYDTTFQQSQNKLCPGNKRLGLSPLLQFSWLLSNISTTVGICISIIFWAVLYPMAMAENFDLPLNYAMIQTHAINAVFIILDSCLTSFPFRMSHVYQPILFGMIYLVFTAIYWEAGGVSITGREIYPILAWDKPLTALPILGIVILMTFIHGMFVLLTKYLDRVASKYKRITITVPLQPEQHL